jgi:hypothetical protein
MSARPDFSSADSEGLQSREAKPRHLGKKEIENAE